VGVAGQLYVPDYISDTDVFQAIMNSILVRGAKRQLRTSCEYLARLSSTQGIDQ
jgi:3-deoxy-D-manno-octulosonate 8-phosphate phosphatase KdsC-like HAD superfamily phosphatase